MLEDSCITTLYVLLLIIPTLLHRWLSDSTSEQRRWIMWIITYTNANYVRTYLFRLLYKCRGLEAKQQTFKPYRIENVTTPATYFYSIICNVLNCGAALFWGGINYFSEMCNYLAIRPNCRSGSLQSSKQEWSIEPICNNATRFISWKILSNHHLLSSLSSAVSVNQPTVSLFQYISFPYHRQNIMRAYRCLRFTEIRKFPTWGLPWPSR